MAYICGGGTGMKSMISDFAGCQISERERLNINIDTLCKSMCDLDTICSQFSTFVNNSKKITTIHII